MIPFSFETKAIIAVITAIALVGFGFKQGIDWEEAKQQRISAGIQQANIDALVQAGQDNAIRTRELETKLAGTRERTRVVREQVPVYITREADAACSINRGFVELHDATAADRVPAISGSASEPAVGIALSTVAGTVVENYGRCHAWRHQLISTIAWARKYERDRQQMLHQEK